MKLYYAPSACSLAPHIALREAGIPFRIERVDLKTKRTASGEDFLLVNPKGYVPALVFDDGTVITENLAVLDYLATRSPAVGVDGRLGRTRLLEALAYITTELHKSFKPFFADGTEHEKAKASAYVARRLQYLADQIDGDFLFGNRPSVADFYLFVMLRWAQKFEVSLPVPLMALHDRIKALPSAQDALSAEASDRMVLGRNSAVSPQIGGHLLRERTQ